MLLAYSKYLDVELWFQPTSDNPDIKRLTQVSSICSSVIVFYPILMKTDVHLRNMFDRALSSAQCVHVYRNMEIVAILRHTCIIWDLDEIPWDLRDESRNSGLKFSTPHKKDERVNQFTKALEKSTVVLTSSPLEIHNELGEVTVIPNVYVDIPIYRKKNHTCNLLFVGNLNYQPNVDAVLFFAKHILPLLPSYMQLHVVGRTPINQEILVDFNKLSLDSRITFFYDVQRCSPYYFNAAVAIIPLRFGGGTKLKILEAFAHSCPVVSTSIGCEGLLVKDGVELLVRNAVHDFAQACIAIIEKPLIGENLAKKAYDLIVNEYSQDVIDKHVHSVLRGISILQH